MTFSKTIPAKIPAPIREGAKQIYTTTATLRPEFLPSLPLPLAPSAEGETDAATLFAADPASTCLAPDEAVLQSYLLFCTDETPATLSAFVAAGTALAERVDACLHAMKQREGSTNPPTDPPPGESLASILARWQQEWCIVKRWWELWSAGTTLQGRPPTAMDGLMSPDAPCLCADQRRVMDRLMAIWYSRQEDGIARNLSRGILRQWSHPMIVGPAGAGKAFAAQEMANRLGLAFGRWEIGSWSTIANRSGRATLDGIERFCSSHPDGVVIYLAGVDALTSARIGGDRGGDNVSWWGSVTSELESFLDSVSTRKPFGSDNFRSPMVVLGSRFGMLWGEPDVGGPSGAEAWRAADGEPLTEPQAVAEWLAQHGGLPAGLSHRLGPIPLVVGRLNREEATTLAAGLVAALPPALDGVFDVNALTAALGGPSGWRSVVHLVEEGLLDVR